MCTALLRYKVTESKAVKKQNGDLTANFYFEDISFFSGGLQLTRVSQANKHVLSWLLVLVFHLIRFGFKILHTLYILIGL